VSRVTILDEGRACEVDGFVRAGRVVLPEGSLRAALDFEVKPEGLCKGDVCIPVRPGSGLEVDDGFDVSKLAELLGRPVAVNADVAAAYFGAPAIERAAKLSSLEAPDFTLPDLDGKMHSLSEHRGKKVILAAYASW
jgi:hypothetical protein